MGNSVFHISDCKKYNRCPKLFVLDQTEEKNGFQKFVRIDQEITDLAIQKLKIEDYFLGARGDDSQLAMNALNSYDWLVKARFEYKQLRVKIPFLHKVGEKYDVYFLYMGLFPHTDDLQSYANSIWVLQELGLMIGDIKVMHLNGSYVRGDTLNVDELFVVSDYFYNQKNNPTVLARDAIFEHVMDISEMLDQMENCTYEDVKNQERTRKCAGRQKCRFYEKCFPEETSQEYNSILTLIGAQHRYEMQKEGIKLLRDTDIERIEGTRQQYAQIKADQQGGLFADRIALENWLKDIRYPIIFLDFEWECFAVPPYEGMKPYDVLPFEYSIHIMNEKGELEHKVFLSIHDDRRGIAQGLVNDIPDTGTVIAYNSDGAEKIRIRELASLYPEYSEKLIKINERMMDLQLPFVNGWIYDTRMGGVWTLKRIMSLMDDPGYSEIDIHQGMDAVFQWRSLDRGDPDADQEKIIRELREYCGMDTYAMTVVLNWIFKICRGD